MIMTWLRTATPPGRYRVLAYKGVIDCWASFYALKANEPVPVSSS